MKQSIFWASLSLASLLTALYIARLEDDFSGDLLVDVVPIVTGRTVAFVLVPAILVGGIVLIRKLFKRSTSNTVIFAIGATAWAILALSSLSVSSLESGTRNSSMAFAPEGCEYSVSFPSEPETYTQQKAAADGTLLPLHGAQLVVGGGAAQIRAECGSTGGGDLSQFSPDNFIGYMTEIATDLGLSRPSFEVEETTLGNIGTITGVRDTERGRITVRIINIVGDASILTLYLMAFSTDFQTEEMVPFVESVKRR